MLPRNEEQRVTYGQRATENYYSWQARTDRT